MSMSLVTSSIRCLYSFEWWAADTR